MSDARTRQEVSVSSGEVHAARGDGILAARAIGSCVVVTAYDPAAAVGGMAHVMLPGVSPAGDGRSRIRYARDAVNALMHEMVTLGAQATRLRACLVGGANVLGLGHDSPGRETAESIGGILQRQGIEVAAREVGGGQRRSCVLEVGHGRVTYTVGDSEPHMLWQAESGSARRGACGARHPEPLRFDA